ncbi:GumC family protein, partial [Candidatus Omnitrophota bacterium]
MEQLYELNLRDYAGIFLKRKWEVVIVSLIVFATIFFYTYIKVPMYRASVLLRVESQYGIPSQVITDVRTYWGNRFELSDYTKHLTSSPVFEAAARRLGWITDETDKVEKNRAITRINGMVSASEIEKSNIISLSSRSSDPQKAADVANMVAEEFKRINSEQKNEQAHNVRIFIEKTLKDVFTQLKEQETRLRELTTAGAVGLAVDIVERISVIEKRLSELSTKFTDRHPNVLSLREEVKELKGELKELPEEEFEYGILKRDIRINEKLYTSLKEQLQSVQIREAEKIDNVIIVNPAITPRIPYYPKKSRNYMFGLVLGLVLGVGVALITEHLDTSIGRVDDIENFIKIGVMGVVPYLSGHKEGEHKEEHKNIKNWFSFFKRDTKKTELMPTSILDLEKSDDNSLFLESFRLLGVNLQVAFGEGGRIKNKLILITSCRPEEGKTLISSTLGIVMAQMGYRVLVLDTDVRRAHIHKSFGLKDKDNGLTDILTGKMTPEAAVKTATDLMLGQASIDNIIERPWINNLNIVTAGSTFPNTINLFNSARLDEAFDFFRKSYDIIILDTSPILAVSEPSVLLPKV